MVLQYHQVQPTFTGNNVPIITMVIVVTTAQLKTVTSHGQSTTLQNGTLKTPNADANHPQLRTLSNDKSTLSQILIK